MKLVGTSKHAPMASPSSDAGSRGYYRTDGKKTMRVLSIDAWSDGDGGYTWNNWFLIGSIPRDTPTDMMVEAAYDEFIFNNPTMPAGYTLVDDQYNIVVQDPKGCPIYAFEYGDEA